ncbi:MAG: MFS transporter [Actinomycetota bacterium]
MSAAPVDTDPAEPTPPSRWARTFSSLELPEYRRLWFAGALSFAAMPMQAVARGFLAFELTGTNSALGLVFLGMGLPMLIATPFGGVAADRLPKRTVLFFSNGVLALSAIAIAIALLTDSLQFWMLVVSAAFQGASFAFIAPTRLAFSAELVGRDRLVNAILLAQISMNATRVIGPGLAGALIGIAVVGPEGVYLLLSLILLSALVMITRLPRGEPIERSGRTSPFDDIRAGLGYVRAHPEIGRPTFLSLLVVAAAFPYVSFLPSLVDDVLGGGPGWLGALSSVGAVGAVVVSLRIAGRRDARITDHHLALSGLAFGFGVALLGVVPGLWIALGAAFVAGAGTAAFQSLSNSLVLLRADEQYHGRVQSLLMLGFSAFGIFAAPLGALADAIGLRTTLVLMGTVTWVAVGAMSWLARRHPVDAIEVADD